MSRVGIPSVMQTISSISASAASMMASAANGGGTGDHRCVRAGLVHGFLNAVEDRPAFVCGAALAGSYAAYDLGAVFGARFGVKRTLAAGQALDHYSR